MNDSFRRQIELNDRATTWALSSIPVVMIMIGIPPILARFIGYWAFAAIPLLFVIPFSMIGRAVYLMRKADKEEVEL